MEQVRIRELKNVSLKEFLSDKDFFVEQITDGVLKVRRSGEHPVYLTLVNDVLYFEADLGSLEGIGSEKLYLDLLVLNMEILPVSIGIDTTNSDDKRLVLVESREVADLDSSEILSVFDAIELAVDKIESVLSEFVI